MERIITGLMQRGPAVALLILAAVALRFALRKAPKWTRYVLWISAVCLAVSICFRAGLEGKTGDMSWTQTYYLTFAVGRGKGFFWGQGVGGESLTLEDVIRLSEKGNELEWADFDGYAFWATGSGLMINVYPIDQHFSLWVGGGGGSPFPMYVRLCENTAGEEAIDIRQEDVETFIAGHR